jgi:non-specific serine/threonine protein kinase
MSGATAGLAVARPLPVELTTYVGRRAEIEEAQRLFGVAALVTLTGPGGVGKTRLALRVSAAMRPAFADDVAFVQLAELREPELLVSTVAAQVGLGDRSARPAIEFLVEQLRDRRLLLVLDNCEHLVDACARMVRTLLAKCPRLAILATSRQSLRVPGERLLAVPPLRIAEPEPTAPEIQTPEIQAYDAVRLFADRAGAVVPSFEVTEANAADVLRVCRMLDGLPLAIELAAVRLRALSVRQLADRLDKLFALLGQDRGGRTGRHDTLRATVDWSYELCTEAERLLWQRAAVFRGGFDLDAAERVCSGAGLAADAVLDVIDGLIDKSILVHQEHRGEGRYRMLETLRQYGEDRFRDEGGLADLRRRHRDWCHRLVARFDADWLGPGQLDLMDQLTLEHANLRAALDFCTTDAREAVVGLAMIAALKHYLLPRGLNTEGRLWATRVLDAAPEDAPGRAAAEWVRAYLAMVQRDMPVYETSLSNAAELAERTGDARTSLGYVSLLRGLVALIEDRWESAVGLLERAAGELRAVGDREGDLWSTFYYGAAVMRTGDVDRGRRILRETIETYTALGDVVLRSWALWMLGASEYLIGEDDRAQQTILEVLRLQRLRSYDTVVTAFALTTLAASGGELRRSARLFGAAMTMWRALGTSPLDYPAFAGPAERRTKRVTGELGAEETAREFTAGTGMSMVEALDYALGKEPAPPKPADNPLTRRETEVAELVAAGLTNREIAARLVIAVRTAETHVEHILTKLEFTSRAQIAAWVAGRQP